MKPSSYIHLQVVTKLKFFSLRAHKNAATIRPLSTSDVGAGAGADADAAADAPASVVGAGVDAGVDAVGAVDVGDVDSNTKGVVALVVQATLTIDSFFHIAASLGITVE